jgi:hypothetical protein
MEKHMGALIVAFMVMLIVGAIINNSRAKQVARQAVAATAERDTVADLVEARGQALIEAHRAVLLGKYRASLATDDYGKTAPGPSWDADATYFVKTILFGDPQIDAAWRVLPFTERQAKQEALMKARVFEKHLTQRVAELDRQSRIGWSG